MEQAFIQTIRRSRRRVLAGRLVGWLADAAVFGLLSVIAFGTWAQTSGLGSGAWIAFFAILGSILAAHLVRELVRGTSLEAVAVWLDRELGFFDRISSALQFSRQAEPTGFMRAHMAETAAFLQENADRVVAVPWPERGRAFALFLAIGLVSLLPHTDRVRIEARDRGERVEARRRAGRDLVQELTRLRKEVELSGLTRLSEMVADAEQALSRQFDLVEPEDLEPPLAEGEHSGLPVTYSRPDSPDQALPKGAGAATSGTAGDGVRLGEKALGRAHFEQTLERTSEGGEVVDVSAPPPKDAEFAIQGVTDEPFASLLRGTPEQMAQVAAQTLATGEITGPEASDNSLKVRGGGTAPGGKGAGVGSGAGREKRAPKILPQASGGEYLPLEGKLADGDSVVRLIDARGRRKLGSRSEAGTGALTYREVFVQYALGAEAELNSEKVPLHMRDYIRDYFRSIRPGAGNTE